MSICIDAPRALRRWLVAALVLVALAVVGAAVAADASGGSSGGAKRRVTIQLVLNGEADIFGRFSISSPASTWGDSGRVTGPPSNLLASGTRLGQSWERYRIALTLRGRRGTIEIRSTTTFVSAGNRYQVFTGSWKALGGTDAYAGVTGGGPATGVLDLFAPENSQFQFAYDGFLTTG